MGVKTTDLSGWKYVSKTRTRERIIEDASPYIFLAPFFIGFLVFQLLPILFSIFLSFTSWNGMSAIRFNGVQNFTALFKDANFWNAFSNTLLITVTCTILGTIGALLLAVFLEKIPDTLASYLRVGFFLPSVTSVVVITYIFKQLFSSDYGYINTLMMRFGLPAQNWLLDRNLAMMALILMLFWAGLGWDALIITAGLRSIPAELYDAAKVDGANGYSEFWSITLPLLQPTLLFVLVTSVIFLWGLFAQPQLLTGGGPLRQTQTIALYLYEAGFRYHKFGYASAMAIILSLVMFLSSLVNFRFVKTNIDY